MSLIRHQWIQNRFQSDYIGRAPENRSYYQENLCKLDFSVDEGIHYVPS